MRMTPGWNETRCNRVQRRWSSTGDGFCLFSRLQLTIMMSYMFVQVAIYNVMQYEVPMYATLLLGLPWRELDVSLYHWPTSLLWNRHMPTVSEHMCSRHVEYMILIKLSMLWGAERISVMSHDEVWSMFGMYELLRIMIQNSRSLNHLDINARYCRDPFYGRCHHWFRFLFEFHPFLGLGSLEVLGSMLQHSIQGLWKAFTSRHT